MRNIASAVILAACAVQLAFAQTSAIQPSGPSPAVETKTFALQSNGRLKVANVNGAVKVTAWDKDEVALTATFQPSRRNNEYPKIEVDSTKNCLELVVKYPTKERSEMGSCEIELSVPRRVSSKISTVNGSIALNGIEGRHNISTVNGGIAFDRVSGQLGVSTVNGGISGSVQKVKDGLYASTVNGGISIALSDPNCTLKASNVNGGVTLKAPGAKDVSAKKNSVRATFGDGDAKIRLSSVNGGIVVQ